jgi:hypothetical protein
VSWLKLAHSTSISSVEFSTMVGRQQAAQAPLFYTFNLDDHIPANHLLCCIDQFLDLSELHQHLDSHYTALAIGMVIEAAQVAGCIAEFTLGQNLHPTRATRLEILLCPTGIALLLPAQHGRHS